MPVGEFYGVAEVSEIEDVDKQFSVQLRVIHRGQGTVLIDRFVVTSQSTMYQAELALSLGKIFSIIFAWQEMTQRRRKC